MSNYSERCGYLLPNGLCARPDYPISCDPETEAICEEEEEQRSFGEYLREGLIEQYGD